MAELDQEEREILKAFEAGQLNRAVDADELLKRHREYAAAMLRTDARINVRLTTRDLRRL
jgi:predicted DNA binding CopG/RHH family protein